MRTAWLSGALAGSVHAVSGPDHLAALIPLCMGKGLKAFREGAVWGLGHGIGCSIMGFFGVMFKKFINVNLISEYMEFVVGFTLILLGFLGIRRSQKWEKDHKEILCKDNNHNIGDIESNPSRVNNVNSVKRSFPMDLASNSMFNKFTDYLDYSPLVTILVTGIIHGLSGTGHILGVIPALTYKDITNGMKYLFAFCVGTAVSMSIFTMFVGMIGVLITYSLSKDVKKIDDQQYNQTLPASISFYASIFSVFVGVIWIIQPLLALLTEQSVQG